MYVVRGYYTSLHIGVLINSELMTIRSDFDLWEYAKTSNSAAEKREHRGVLFNIEATFVLRMLVELGQDFLNEFISK